MLWGSASNKKLAAATQLHTPIALKHVNEKDNAVKCEIVLTAHQFADVQVRVLLLAFGAKPAELFCDVPRQQAFQNAGGLLLNGIAALHNHVFFLAEK